MDTSQGNQLVVLFAPYGEWICNVARRRVLRRPSRGPEYELDISEPFVLSSDSTVDLEFHLSDQWIHLGGYRQTFTCIQDLLMILG